MFMRVESLENFLEIVQAGSFSLAARQLYISQQGLSTCVRTLERELGVTLFERSEKAGKRVHLTEAGRRLVPLAQALIEDHNEIRAAMGECARQSQNTKRLQLIMTRFITSALFTHMGTKLDAYGLRNVSIDEKSLQSILEEMGEASESSADLAIIDIVEKSEHEALLAGAEVEYTPLIKTQLVLVGTNALISPRRKSISIEEVAQLPVALFSEATMDNLIHETFKTCPLENVVLRSSNAQMLNEMTVRGQVVSFSDSFSAFQRVKTSDLLFVPIKNAASFTLGFLRSPNKVLRDEVLDYMDRFRACLKTTSRAYLLKHLLATE